MTNRKKQKGSDTAVQGTNDSSVVSKVSAAAQGYFHDLFLQHFVCKVARRAPLINRGYYVRWKAVDHCLRSFLKVTQQCAKRQILSLGAGFDSLYFRLYADSALDRAVVFEMDFPEVTRRKAALIRSNVSLSELLDLQPEHSPTGPVYVSSSQYKLIGVDVRNEAQVEEALGMAGLDLTAPTLILSEVVLTYMETQQSDDIISWAARRFPQSLFVIYEQIHPQDPFGRIMQEHFHKLNSTLHALRKYPDSDAQKKRFLDKGWDQCVCVNMNEFFLGFIGDDERCRVERLEPFDEYEEWHQKCSHYFILTASQGSLTAQSLLAHPTVPLQHQSRNLSDLIVKTQPVLVEGLGMASTMLDGGRILLTGGSCRTSRGAPSRVLLKGSEGWRSAHVESSAHLSVRLYHTATSVPGGVTLIYGGRSSPLNPVKGLLKVNLNVKDTSGPDNVIELHAEETVCTGSHPPLRWRHSATLVSHKGKNYLFVFGGKNESESVLDSGYFLDLDMQHWTELAVEGEAPEARHSHSACSYKGGLVLFGGHGRRGEPLGDIVVMKPNERSFCWEKIDTHPPLCPRYSHDAHVIGDHLIVVGGVWLHSDSVPGVAIVNLSTRCSIEFSLDTTSVPWPLMLHSFCSELMVQKEAELILIGGGGNCFSFGTHFNPQIVTVDLGPVLT
ncbi:tRNA wybutosine-synthesizing protein 4 [Corythoichthys intestinalis]|uniref:tRNA wybutosine-synthesizing protein 4 n=1 Tax=Corythoichthys intestinalis TaxID=161448 RepID=UPI0025A5EB87|nr:tRNA wybutosine-synthesizing protein 4 [Corythoichthys intestinalis]XP_057707904.1 tRNA wybutosine-synthesizing protein 4 [Corythoichthys intestinalis]XP_057707905.1 tRNA wybutosine-synthesizing protein 4 [Corythoichthys intestinalis]